MTPTERRRAHLHARNRDAARSTIAAADHAKCRWAAQAWMAMPVARQPLRGAK